VLLLEIATLLLELAKTKRKQKTPNRAGFSINHIQCVNFRFKRSYRRHKKLGLAERVFVPRCKNAHPLEMGNSGSLKLKIVALTPSLSQHQRRLEDSDLKAILLSSRSDWRYL